VGGSVTPQSIEKTTPGKLPVIELRRHFGQKWTICFDAATVSRKILSMLGQATVLGVTVMVIASRPGTGNDFCRYPVKVL